MQFPRKQKSNTTSLQVKQERNYFYEKIEMGIKSDFLIQREIVMFPVPENQRNEMELKWGGLNGSLNK